MLQVIYRKKKRSLDLSLPRDRNIHLDFEHTNDYFLMRRAIILAARKSVALNLHIFMHIDVFRRHDALSLPLPL